MAAPAVSLRYSGRTCVGEVVELPPKERLRCRLVDQQLVGVGEQVALQRGAGGTFLQEAVAFGRVGIQPAQIAGFDDLAIGCAVHHAGGAQPIRDLLQPPPFRDGERDARRPRVEQRLGDLHRRHMRAEGVRARLQLARQAAGPHVGLEEPGVLDQPLGLKLRGDAPRRSARLDDELRRLGGGAGSLVQRRVVGLQIGG